MSRYRLEKLPNLLSAYDSTQVTYEFDATTLDEMLEDFAMFLKGCGFSFDGELVIEEIDDQSS